ncbi:MAG: RHS repeat-associated core domain-containing protein, partial [Candidatus Wallbacteria bacterium]|nr:RHS repeat-associated core domain-containing protein [Candidatus Wallbacteria bacterium]
THGDRQEVTFAYNPDGSLTAKSGAENASYTYGAFGRLEKVVKDGTTVSYQYCPLGKRIGRTFSGPDGSGFEKFYYINDNIFEIENDKGSRKVVLGLGVDEIYGEMDEQDNARYFFQDYLGSVKMEFDENGNITTMRRYRAFGDEPYDRASGFGFTGREWDDAAEIYFYRSRYYDPKIGRFLQRDIFNETAMLRGDFGVMHNPLQMNDWAYVGNNGVNFGDPYGDRGPRILELGIAFVLGTIMYLMSDIILPEQIQAQLWEKQICAAGINSATVYSEWLQKRDCSINDQDKNPKMEKINEIFESDYQRVVNEGCRLTREKFSEIYFSRNCWRAIANLP